MTKRISAIFMVLIVIVAFSLPTFAESPTSRIPEPIRIIEFGVTYQGSKAGLITAPAEGPEQYFIYCPSARTIQITLDHNDPIGNENGPSRPNPMGDGGFIIDIDNGQSGIYGAFNYHTVCSFQVAAGYHLIGVLASRYAVWESTYTIRVD